ncbi:MAG: SDR family NAD(P)-dependent oxidoreductase [Firmicutes bacterium]|uniref:Ketoreductase domain-containing protein n=1 Tax=Melghirimyces thermohalophilus TaxID=1236220 RepID=A0A1G6N9Q0_9BACL|nr:SDR family NAD(P)-dependent oxidoreductase [Melghirimyces thermohalophilus]MDA8354309.1 SDR family NAD(P)-dependent oxidoreductase [Bacillota bacterium]SDC63956.1 hypothetical protein SAMN04488112_11244 [Melghirimyces thermohalophilus]
MSRVVLITGGSSGIGKEIARQLTMRGDIPLLLGRNKANLKRVQEELKRGDFFVCDVTKQGEVEAVVSKVIKRYGSVDVLINNAGYGRFGGALDFSPDEYRAMMETNYLGAVQMTLAMLPHWLQQGGGKVVNIASIAGLSGTPNLAAYAASKFALIGFSESLHLEYAPLIQVGVLCPGPVKTPFFRGEDPGQLFPPALSRKLLDTRVVARHALRLIEHPRMKVIPASLRWAIRVRSWFPGLYHHMTHRLYSRWQQNHKLEV